MKLITIQKRENLNYVTTEDNYLYTVKRIDSDEIVGTVNYQKGPRKEESSIHGVLDGDLLEIIRHRLSEFQKGELRTRENAIALTHIEEALLWMNKRVEDRIERNVLGTYNK